MTQEEFAERIGISQNYLSTIPMPSPGSLVRTKERHLLRRLIGGRRVRVAEPIRQLGHHSPYGRVRQPTRGRIDAAGHRDFARRRIVQKPGSLPPATPLPAGPGRAKGDASGCCMASSASSSPRIPSQAAIAKSCDCVSFSASSALTRRYRFAGRLAAKSRMRRWTSYQVAIPDIGSPSGGWEGTVRSRCSWMERCVPTGWRVRCKYRASGYAAAIV